MTDDRAPGRVIEAITLDFGNTLVPVPGGRPARGRRADRRGRWPTRLGPFDEDEVLRRLDRGAGAPVPRGGAAVPRGGPRRAASSGSSPGCAACRRRPPTCRWDDAAARLAQRRPQEVAWAMDVYSRAFVDALPPPPGAAALLGRLAARYRLAILSNWPLATTIDRYAEAAGWSPYLAAIVVSQRVGTIKPQPAIFAAAAAALGDPPPRGDPPRRRRLGGGRGRGQADGLAGGVPPGRPADSPLPGSDRGDATDPACGRTWSSRRRLERPGGARSSASLTPAPRRRSGRAASVDSLAMERRDRIANLGAAGRGRGRVDPGRASSSRPATRTRTPWRATSGALLIGLAVGITAIPLCWLVVFARHRRIAYQGDWFRAARRGGWVGLFVAALVVLRLSTRSSPPIVAVPRRDLHRRGGRRCPPSADRAARRSTGGPMTDTTASPPDPPSRSPTSRRVPPRPSRLPATRSSTCRTASTPTPSPRSRSARPRRGSPTRSGAPRVRRRAPGRQPRDRGPRPPRRRPRARRPADRHPRRVRRAARPRPRLRPQHDGGVGRRARRSRWPPSATAGPARSCSSARPRRSGGAARRS